MSRPAGSAAQHSLDDFLGHSNRAGGGAAFLENWKNRDDPSVRVVLHTRAPIISVWQHPWPKIVTREVKGKDVREVWGGNFNSWETEEILQRQYLREDDGTRSFPPEVCPMSILLEEVERLMREGELDWRTPLFKFVGDDPTKAKVLHAGSMTNRVKKIWEDASDDDKRKAKKAGFPGPSDAWKESMMAKCSYVFTVVDYDDVDSGIQIDKETTLVGDKAKKAIRDRMTSLGDEKGNPLLHPVVFQFKHVPKAKQFQDRYEVVIIERLEITDPILELIRDKEPPDLSRYTAPGNIEELRASMEDHYVGPADLLDFDFIFAKAEELAGLKMDEEEEAGDIADAIAGSEEDDAAGETETEAEAESEADAEAEPEEAAEPEVDRVIAKRDKDQNCFNAAGEQLYGCEKCAAIMLESEAVCYNCGEDYSEDLDEEPEPEPPPRRAKKAGAAKAAPAGSKAPAKAAATTKGKGKASDRAAQAGRDVGF